MSQARPTMAIFCKELSQGGDPFSSNYYWRAYRDLLFALKDRGVNAYFATDNNLYRGFGIFDRLFTLQDRSGATRDITPVENVQVDLVFDRGRFIGRDVLVINPPILTKIAMSKIEMYEYFADLQPYSVVGNSKRQVIRAINQILGEKVVVKEPEGSGGKEVYIGEKKEVLQKLPPKYPMLVQEFLDTSIGIPGIVEGVHDARLKFCGNEIISYYVRSAKDGKLHANLAQGGTGGHFDLRYIPAELLEAAHLVDGLFADAPRFYAIDFVNTPKGWKLVELNSYLGLMSASGGPHAKMTFNKLADYLTSQCRKEFARKQSRQ